MVPTTAARKATRNHPAAEAAKDFLDLTTGNYRTLLAGRRNVNAALRDVKRTWLIATNPFDVPRVGPRDQRQIRSLGCAERRRCDARRLGVLVPSRGHHVCMERVGRLGWIQIDCADPVGLARFWSHVLGVEIESALGEPPHYLGLVPASSGAPVVSFHRVSEAKVGKNRLHFDIAVDDVGAASARIEDLGGVRLPFDEFGEYGFHWRVMADPEGNEFCLVYSLP
jgi:predicted enzyme related to lactoylglutathione lyase